MELRCLTLEDLSGADELRRAAGWNQTLVDWKRLLTLDPDGCFGVEDQGRLLGTATTTSFGLNVAWIGMLLVHPSARSQGIGRQLFTRCLEHLQAKGVACLKLDATPAGQVLYEKLGFKIEWPLARWMKPPGNLTPLATASSATEEMKPTDWDAVLKLDLHAFGVNRERLLRRLAQDGSRCLVARASNGILEGFGFSRAGVDADYMGPVVATNEAVGKALAHRLIEPLTRTVYWDVPGPCTPAADFATKLGFTQQRPLLRMHRGENKFPGTPPLQWAISDPATG